MGAILSNDRGAASHPLVSKWAAKAPGPSAPTAISFVQNECTHWNRKIVGGLKKAGLTVDAYGKCMNSRPTGFDQGVWKRDMYEKKLAILSTHMFDLAIENNQDDPWWNTERLYHALLVHTIPIYRGSKTFLRRIPHKDAVIDAAQYGDNVEKLAAYVKEVSNNKTLQQKHLHWTSLPPDQWENGFPDRHRNFSRLRGAMCRVCDAIRQANK